MRYNPKILYNPTNKVIEFKCDGLSVVFQPGEKKNLDGFVAHHALVDVNTGLREYVAGGEDDVVLANVAYDELPWRQLVSMASARGVFVPGNSKKQVIAALTKSDEQETGTVQEPSVEEA